MGPLLCGFLFAASASALAAPVHDSAGAPAVIKEIPYPGARKGDRRRSLDLYLPPNTGSKPPLLIFVHGGFWLLSDDDYRIGQGMAEALVREGIAVPLLRYRLAPGAPHPAQAEEVAAGVALLVRQADRYGYDANRIFLSGHSAGGHIAALGVDFKPASSFEFLTRLLRQDAKLASGSGSYRSLVGRA